MRSYFCLILWIGLTPAFAFCAPPELKAPKEVTGEVGDFIPITVETEGKQVKFVAITPGLKVFPSGFLANQKSTVVASKEEGEYKLLCYTGKGDEVSEPVYILVKIGAGGGMNGVHPITKDPLFKPIQDAYRDIPGVDKVKQKKTLAAVYKATADSISGVDTAGALFGILKSAADSGIGEGNLIPLREQFGKELGKFLPKAQNQVLTTAEKDEVTKQLRRFSTILEQVK